ncbi:MAG: oxidoreductase domain-containing [Geobacteraceae bacterium]|nr:MAG: oxidoreductase domain-containing [Geobacteraceae bacterium]
MKLKAGFIGFGRMGLTHFSILNNHPQVDVCAICDQSSTMLDVLKKYLKIRVYSDYKTMLSSEKLDFVIVSTPTDSHAEIIKAAIDQNLHIFSEKPFSLSTEEGEGIVAYLDGKPLVNQVGYVNRFNEVFMEVKGLLQAGLIGEVKCFSSEMYGATVLKDAKSNWRSKKNMGGGCMYEMASHCIDLAVYLFGKPDRVAGSIMQSIYSSDVEDLVSSTLIYNNGYNGTIHVNWSDAAYRKPTNIVKIFGAKGKIVADKHAYKVYLREAAPAHDLFEGWNTRYITDFAESVRFYVRGNEFTRQLDSFVECIKQKKPETIANFAEALKTDMVMEEITLDAERSLTYDPVPAQKEGTRSSSLLRRFLK